MANNSEIDDIAESQKQQDDGEFLAAPESFADSPKTVD